MYCILFYFILLVGVDDGFCFPFLLQFILLSFRSSRLPAKPFVDSHPSLIYIFSFSLSLLKNICFSFYNRSNISVSFLQGVLERYLRFEEMFGDEDGEARVRELAEEISSR